MDSIPQPDAGITNSARVPADTSLAVLIASVHGVDVGDPVSIRFSVDDGELDPLTPMFGPVNEIEGVAAVRGMEDVGLPLNLMPHTVFNTPVKVFIPAPDGFDLTEIGIYYSNGLEWLPACDKNGNVLPGGQSWMVAGSRVNHIETSPPLIEIQVYHFSAVQGGVVVVNSGGTSNDRVSAGDSGGAAAVKCFIDTAAYDAKPAFGLLAVLWAIGMIGLLPLLCSLKIVLKRA